MFHNNTSKFTFKYEDINTQFESPNTVITIEVNGNQTREELIGHFQAFLLASGFSLPEGASLGYEYEDNLSVGCCVE